MYIILFLLIWAIIGSSGFIFWWTSEHDLTEEELDLIFVACVLGPISWVSGYFIHTKNKNKIILMKRRK